jgi:hypothetical protein
MLKSNSPCLPLGSAGPPPACRHDYLGSIFLKLAIPKKAVSAKKEERVFVSIAL